MLSRNLRHLKPALAMIGLAGFVLGSNSFGNSVVPGQSSADAVQIRMADGSSTDGLDGSLVFRSARRPIILPISFKIVEGGPQIQPDALEVVLEALRDNPRRLVTIEVEGLPISFKGLPRSTRGKLLERGGPEFPGRYDGFVVRELVSLLDGVRGARPNSPIAIEGLPFDGDGGNDSLLNERFEPVISRLSAFVLDRGVVVSSRSDEKSMVLRSFPNAVSLADGRAVIYPLNLGWRLAIEGESLASTEVDENAEPQSPDDELFTGTRATALGDSAPLMSDLEDLGVAGRGSRQPVTTRASARGSSVRGLGGASVPDVGGSGTTGGVAGPAGGGRGFAALPFARNEEVDIDPPTNAAGEEDLPADEGDEEDLPADEGDEEDPPADEGDDEDPPADEGDEEDPPADEGDEEDPPADEGDEEDPPADEGDEEDPPADEGDDEDPPAGEGDEEDPPADEGDDEDPPAGEGDEEDPPADEGDDEDPPADEGDEEDPPADEGDDEDPPADEGDEEDPPADEGDEEDPPADEGDEEDPPADEGDEEDPPADEGDDEDPPADEGDEEDPPADEGDEEDPPADEGDEEDPPADEGDEEDPPADEGDEEDPPADEGDDEGDWNPGDEVDEDEADNDPPDDQDGGGTPPDDEADEDPPVDDPPAGDDAGDDPPSNDASRLLESGDGFDGEQEAISPIGDPNAPGYDCQAIARWDVVPGQLVTSDFSIGVVAFHRDGIDRVDFSLNGGPWKSIYESAMNLRTGVNEYYAVISPDSMPEGESEIRAIVYPTNGEPRVLAGPMGTGAWGVVGDDIPGEYSLFLGKNSEPPAVCYVSNSGSDDVGDGSYESPFRTITWAAWNLVGRQVGGKTLSDCEIRLFPGVYGGTYAAGWPIRSASTGSHGWLTITKVEGASREDVVFSHSGTGGVDSEGIRWTLGNLRLNDVTVRLDPSWNPPTHSRFIFHGTSSSKIWYDNISVEGNYVLLDQSAARTGWGFAYSTDSVASECWTTPLAGEIQRNGLIDGLMQDALRGGLAVNNVIRNQSRELHPNWLAMDIHSDVFQIWNHGGLIENHIVYGLDATEHVLAQGTLLGDANQYKDMAFVDVFINNTNHGSGSELGHHYNLYWSSPHKHTVVRNSGFTGGMYRFTAGAPWNQGNFAGEDVVFENVRLIDPVTSAVSSDLFFPFPDGPSPGWAGHYSGTALPWTSWDSLVEYRE